MRWTALCLLALPLAACGEKEPADSGAAQVDADGDGSLLGEDCDDNDADVYPGAAEICDGADNDCDGLTDDEDDGVTGQSAFYMDADLDGWGGAETVMACTQPSNAVTQGGDCDDDNISIHPAATETCDGVDNDCDELIDDDDEDLSGATSYYVDQDSDGYGGVVAQACEVPSDAAREGGDCDDADADVHPGAAEVCDGYDNDCDGLTDDDDQVSDGETYYADSDGDGYGDRDSSGTRACSQPSNTATERSDCDDSDAAVSPGAAEVCDDTVDNDCDGQTDEDCGAATRLIGARVHIEGSTGYQVYDCELYHDMNGVGTSTSSCPECDFAFNVTHTYVTADSTNNGGCAWAGDYTQLIGFDLNYYGRGYPVMWFKNGSDPAEAYPGNALTFYGDASGGLATWTYGYLDYAIGSGYYFSYYEYGYALFY